ncbi:MAG: two-component system alkaline phosphatase synthesis response regulator PhoP, partial [Bacteroidia bacterium]
DEFLLRVQSLLKRGVNTINRTVDSFKFGSCSIDFNSFTIKDLTGTEHQLSKREMKLLRLFVERRNEVLSRETILETVWGYDVFPSTRTIDNYILAFRKYFEKDPKDPNHFLSVRSVGYKFVA